MTDKTIDADIKTIAKCYEQEAMRAADSKSLGAPTFRLPIKRLATGDKCPICGQVIREKEESNNADA